MQLRLGWKGTVKQDCDDMWMRWYVREVCLCSRMQNDAIQLLAPDSDKRPSNQGD